jgi:hypothetical protein
VVCDCRQIAHLPSEFNGIIIKYKDNPALQFQLRQSSQSLYHHTLIYTMTASAMASSSRVVLETISSVTSRRTVVHHARPVRQPILRAPQTPKIRLPTAGTSFPNANPSSPKSASPVRSTSLQGTNYTLHHAPPPSAPSYTTGVMPPFLQWCKGNSIALTGEEGARLRKERKAEIEGGLGWDEAMLEKMRGMRAEGLSRRQIGEA